MFTSRIRTGFAACTVPAALVLSLFAPHAARAQVLTLGSGDVVTVSSTGTVGTVGGTPVANTTSSYDDTASQGYYAVRTSGTAAFTASGGTFTDIGRGGSYALFATGTGPVTVSGGTFNSTYVAINIFTGSSVTVTGGTFTGNSESFYNGGTIDLYGTFNGYTPGTVTALTSGNGSFFGTLQNNTVAQTFTYTNRGTLNLHNVAPAPAAAPEPSQFAAYAVGLLGLGALAIKAKRRMA